MATPTAVTPALVLGPGSADPATVQVRIAGNLVSVTVTLLASYSGLLGGAERALLQFASGTPGERWLACPDGPLADAAGDAGVRVTALGDRRLELRGSFRDRVGTSARVLNHGRELRALIASLEPDLVILCGMRSMLGLAATPGRSGTSPGPAPIVFLHNDFLPGTGIGAALRRAARIADLIVVPSRAVADDLGLAAAVLPPGVPPGFFTSERAPADPPEVLVLGALVSWKRTDLALEAVALARRDHPDLALRIAGGRVSDDSDAVLAATRTRAAEPDLAGHVELLGTVTDPAAELARCTCLLHCADREPFGIAVAEALAGARPAVVTAGSGPAEIVDASCGITYPPGDAAAAAAAIGQLIADPAAARSLGAHGRARAAEQFTEAAARERFAAAIDPLLQSRSGSRSAARADARGRLSAWTIVTVTHNSAAVLEGLLGSVATHAPAAQLIVVDNASADNSRVLAEAWSDRLSIKTLSLTENLGFGAACNRGMGLVETPVSALLNPDVELVDDSLELLIAQAASAPPSAPQLLGPLVLSADASRQHTAHPAPGSIGDRIHSLVPPAALPARLAAASPAPWRSITERPVGWLVGAALVARTATLTQLGPFDPRFFLYGEDLDLSLRARAAGVDVRFCPRARVLHHGAHSSETRFGGEPFELLARARHDAVAANLGPGAAARDDRLQMLTFASRAGLKAMTGRPRTRERAQFAAVRKLGSQAR